MELNEQPYVAGEMKAIFFENPSNFYKVILLEIEECNFKTEKDEIVITGNFGEITTDTHYRFVGNVINHPRYGTQFQAISYEREKPTGKNGLIGYLSSDRFPGIGKRTAEKIVEHFGENTIDAILDDPDSLAAISGLTKQKQELIHDVLQQSQGTEKTLIELANYGFSNNMAATIMNFYKTETLKTIRENPYQLVEDIEGMGFRTADRLAEDLGFPADDKNRIKGALLATVNELCLSNGDTYVESEELMTRALQLLESSRRFIIEDSQLIEALVEMVQDMKIIEDQKRFALPSLYFSEEGIAGSLDRLLNKKQAIEYPGVDLEKEIHKMQKELGITYDAVQAHAITQAISSAFFILTGGPGTGKTTVLNGIVKLFCELNGLPANPLEYHEGIFPIIMAAPTGRAAKRMNEMTGIQSSTIHRLLGLTGQENPNEDVYTAELEGKLLIIDEASMIDTWLLHRLLKSIPPGMQVIIVGDKDQLPSVGPGQVLHDLLASAVIPQIELEQIYRQAGGSSIIPLAHDIKNGKLPADFNINQSDRSYFPCQAAQIEPLIRIVVEKAKAKGFTSKDIQILAPMYKGPAGINALNTMMQEILNPNTDNKR
ncbi:ATP-dependent RecD-like DNA helicase, partial [Jeotgalibaca porci]